MSKSIFCASVAGAVSDAERVVARPRAAFSASNAPSSFARRSASPSSVSVPVASSSAGGAIVTVCERPFAPVKVTVRLPSAPCTAFASPARASAVPCIASPTRLFQFAFGLNVTDMAESPFRSRSPRLRAGPREGYGIS